MGREPKCRRVESIPKVTVFKPAGIPLSCLKEVVVKLEELEAIRLKDLLGLEQEEGAERMGVSRPTFQRILMEGREKIATALIEGQAIRIEGGNYCLGQEQCRKDEHFQKRRDDCLYRDDYAGENTEKKGGNAMAGTKIAICASGESPSASVDGRFGRCAYFMLWDEEPGSFEAISNSGSGLNQGAGTGAAQELLSRGVGILICNRIGPKAFTVFHRAGVKVYGAGEGLDMETALKQYKAGELPPIEAANNI
jgi:predicted DNA-binding protein (UPF0251 family)/predicted Fe-Mo cluster-binding NifX family protein